jgi:hypothetical protein
MLLARLNALRDGLSQISWLCRVLEERAKLAEGDEERYWEILRGIQERLSERYMGPYTVRNVYKCWYTLSDDMRNCAKRTRCSSDWEEDEWGIRFLELLDGFNKILNDATLVFLRSEREEDDVYLFHSSHENVQEKLAELLPFVYDWKTKMTISANKRRIQYDGEWTSSCYHCVCVTTQFTYEKMGDLDTLYAECIAQKEALVQELHAYALEGALDDKHNIQPFG